MGSNFGITGLEINRRSKHCVGNERANSMLKTMFASKTSHNLHLRNKQQTFGFCLFFSSFLLRFPFVAMISFLLSKLTVLLAVTSLAHEGLALDDSSNDAMRQASPRMRGAFSNVAAAGVIQPRQGVGPVIVEEAEDTMTTELMDSMMSMDVTVEPTDSPSAGPSGGPSLAPTSITSAPSVSMMPSTGPSASQAPSPSAPTTEAPSSSPTIAPTASPMLAPTNAPTIAPATAGPTVAPTDAPSVPDTQIGVIVTDTPTTSPSQGPTSTPSTSPTRLPSTSAPTAIPTVEGCSVSADVREQLILEILDNAADPVAIRDPTTAQGQATEWLLNNDFRKLCPDTPKILQRWVLAVTYFSTGGNDWLKCSANFLANDDCGNEEIFGNKTRFLSGFSECEWAGITCADDICVTEIEFGKYPAERRTHLVETTPH